jgi:EmrB/QacA subfamily drug resistance transporter
MPTIHRAHHAMVYPPPMRWALASLGLAMLLSSFGTSSANVSLPTLMQVFSSSFQAIQWVVLAYLLTITTLIVSVGRLGDLMGRRRLLLIGILLFTCASALCGLAPELWFLILARGAQGVGAAIMMALSLAFVSETVPKGKTGRAMGLIGSMSAFGTAIGPSLSGFLIAGLGWPAIFFINIPLGLLCFGLARRYLPDDRPRARHQSEFDYPGTLLLALTLAAYALAMTIGRSHPGLLNLALLVTAIMAGGLFILVETKASSPLIRLTMLRSRTFSAALGMSALVSTVVMNTLLVGPFYLTTTYHLTPVWMGLVLSGGPVAAALAGIPAGRLVDYVGAPAMTVTGLIGMLTGATALAFVPMSYGMAGYMVPILVITASYALFQTANNTSVMADVAAELRGVTSGMLSLSRNVGLITGASVMGAIFAFGSGTHDITRASPEAVATGMRWTFAVASLLVLLALSLAIKMRHPPVDRGGMTSCTGSSSSQNNPQ